MDDELTPQTPWTDPIVAEVRAAREALLASVDFDLHALCELLRARQAAEGRVSVQLAPRRVVDITDVVA